MTTPAETRDLVITVRAIVPLTKIVESYADAITPDGGFTGTLNAWIEDNAHGIIEDMEAAGTDLAYEHAWELR